MTSDPASGDAVKAMTLLARDLAMFETAASYDLQRPKEKKRSVDDLARLFFWIADILQVDLFIDMVFNYPTLSDSYKYAAYECLAALAR